jgi:hypothetical protein
VRGTCRGPRIGGAFAGMKRGADFCFARLEIGKRDEGLEVVGGVGWLHTDEEQQGFSQKRLLWEGASFRDRNRTVGVITTVNSPLHLK